MKILTSNLVGKYIKKKSESAGEPMFVPNKWSFSREEDIQEISPKGLTAKGNYSVAMYDGEGMKNSNIVRYLDTLVYDFDGTMFLEGLEERLKGYKYVIATTSSHKTKGDRYRVFLELDREFGSEELELYPIIKRMVIQDLGLYETTDKEVAKSGAGWVFRSLSDLEYYTNNGKQIQLDDYLDRAREELIEEQRKKEEKRARRIITIANEYTNDIEVELADGTIEMLSEAEGQNESCKCPFCGETSAYIFRDEITDLPIITCRRVNKCGETYKLRAKPAIEFKDESEGLPEKVEYKELELVREPVDPDRVQQSVEHIWKKDNYGVYPPSFKDAHIVAASAINESILRNRRGEGGRLIIPIPTGGGKTTEIGHYIVEYAKITPREKMGAVVITKFVDEGVKLAEYINKLYGENIAIAINSQMEEVIQPKDYRLYPIIIITHKNYENKVREVQSFASLDHILRREEPREFEPIRFSRELLIIDEALSMIEEHSITTEKLKGFNNDMYMLEREVEIPADVKEVLDFLQKFEDDLVAIRDEVKEMKIKTVPLNIDSEKIGLTDFGEKTKLLEPLRKFINSKEIKPHWAANLKRASKETKKLKDKELRAEWNDRLDDIEKALEHTEYADLDNYGELNLWSTRDIFPKDKSYVITDATGGLDYTLKLTEDDTIIEGFDGIRNYNNLTLLAVRMNSGKNSLDKIESIVPKFVAYTKKVAKEYGLEDSPILLASYKKYKQQIDSLIGEDTDKYRQAHFGNMTGKNEWKDCKVGMYLGQYRKPIWFNRNRIVNVIGSNEAIENEHHVSTYGDMNVIQDFIQALNRQNIRVVNDLDGGCAKNVAVCTIDNNEFGDTIIAVLEKVMKGINIINIDPKELDIVEPAKYKGKNMSLVIETLQRCIPTSNGSLSISDMRKEAGLTKGNWYNIKKSKNFKAHLLAAGYALEKVKGKRYPQFKKVKLSEEEDAHEY